MSEEISFFTDGRYNSRSSNFYSQATPADIKALIEQGADPNEQRSHGSVIGRFCKNGNLKAVRCLIEDYHVIPPLDDAPGEIADAQPSTMRKKSLLYECVASYELSDNDKYLEMVKLLLSTGADRLFNSPLERKYPSILFKYGSYFPNPLSPVKKLLLEYGYPLIEIEKLIHIEAPTGLEEALKKQKADKKAVKEWFKEYTPYPQKEEFLKPLPDHDEPAIVTIIRSGKDNLMKAFQPIEKWVKNENRLDLREIFAVIPRTDFFIQRATSLENALVLESKKQHRIKVEETRTKPRTENKKTEEKPIAARLTVAQKRQALSEILKAVSSPQLKQEIDASVRKRWGWKPRSKRAR